MSAVTIVMSGDDAKLQAALNRSIAQQEKFLAKLKETTSGSKKLSEEEIEALRKKAEEEKNYQKLKERAEKIVRDLTSAEEDYAKAVAEADDMKAKGLLTDEKHAQQLKRLQKELADASGETAKLKRAQEQEEQAVAKATATTQRYMTTVERLQAELADVKAQYDQNRVGIETVERAQRKLKAAQDAAADPTNLGQLNDQIKSYAVGVLSAATAVRGIEFAWRAVKEQQQAGLDALKGTQASDQKLLQVSSSPQEFQQLTAQADLLSRQTGVDRSVTRDVMFQAVSEGFRDVVPEIVAANQVLPPAAAAGVAGQVPALFKGQIDAMSAVSMTLKAAELSRLDFEPLARSLPQAAEGGAIAKATPEETMATLSVLASRFKSGDTAADRIKAFTTRVGIDTGAEDPEFEQRLKTEKERAANAAKELRSKEERVADLEKKLAGKGLTREGRESVQTQLERAQRAVSEFDRSKLAVEEPKRTKPTRKSLAGMGIIKAVEELNAMTDEQRQEFLGDSQELNTAYTVMKEELDKIKAQDAELQRERAARAAGGGTLREKVAIAEADPKQRALRSVAIAEQSLKVTEAEKLGAEGATAAAAQANATQQMLQNEGRLTQIAGKAVTPITTAGGAAIGLNEESSANLSIGATRTITALGGGAPAALFTALERVFRPAKATEDAANKLTEAAKIMQETAKQQQAAAAAQASAAAKLNANARPIPSTNAARAQANAGAQ